MKSFEEFQKPQEKIDNWKMPQLKWGASFWHWMYRYQLYKLINCGNVIEGSNDGATGPNSWMIYWNSSKRDIALGIFILRCLKLATSLSTKTKSHSVEIKKAWWQIIVFLFSRLSLWVVIKVCQMCHWKLPSLKLSTRIDGNNYWNIPIVSSSSTEARKDSRLKRENFHRKNLGNGVERKSDFPVVCARWRMKISDELWINRVIAFAFVVSADRDTHHLFM